MTKCKECNRNLVVIIEPHPELCWSCAMER
jgi:hypothetical protein